MNLLVEQPPELSLCLELKEKFLIVGCVVY
jgi:hypothetical protein